MRDYYCINSGQRVAVADMPTADIQECLAQGFDLIEDGEIPDRTAVVERLRIELTARSLGLR